MSEQINAKSLIDVNQRPIVLGAQTIQVNVQSDDGAQSKQGLEDLLKNYSSQIQIVETKVVNTVRELETIKVEGVQGADGPQGPAGSYRSRRP